LPDRVRDDIQQAGPNNIT
jgi:hypothetical protein